MYYEQCPTGPWLFNPHEDGSSIRPLEISLRNEVCEAIAGAEYKPYSTADIWYRLTAWKFPLFQLVATSPRPPLSFKVATFTVTHLLGDPLGTLTNLLRKYDGCQSRAIYWQTQFCGRGASLIFIQDLCLAEGLAASGDRLWKSFALLIDSYDEWGPAVGDQATAYFQDQLCVFLNVLSAAEG